RRRHTRFSRDWSSDVCSSDLSLLDRRYRRANTRPSANKATRMIPAGISMDKYGKLKSMLDLLRVGEGVVGIGDDGKAATAGLARSEERRVGKDSRAVARRDQD